MDKEIRNKWYDTAQRKSIMVNFRVSYEEYNLLSAIAYRLKCTNSDLIRKALNFEQSKLSGKKNNIYYSEEHYEKSIASENSFNEKGAIQISTFRE
jgi:hypothetical protein